MFHHTGIIGNSPAPLAEAYGTCYDTAVYSSCTYQSGPNYFLLCPYGTNPCTSNTNALPVCCPESNTCYLNKTDNVLECKAPAAPSACGTQMCGASDSCCNDDATGYRCYDSTKYVCTHNPFGNTSLCPTNERACGAACYNSTEYWYVCLLVGCLVVWLVRWLVGVVLMSAPACMSVVIVVVIVIVIVIVFISAFILIDFFSVAVHHRASLKRIFVVLMTIKKWCCSLC
jgi:hypothetical protein